MFSKNMYEVLKNNYQEKGDSWLTCDLSFLQDKLLEEVNEYYTAENDINRMKELLDISNICLFLYVRCMFTSADAKIQQHIKENLGIII